MPGLSVGKILIQRDESKPDKPPVLFYKKLPKVIIQCCGSGMFIPDPNFHPVVPDLGSEFFSSRIRIKEFKYFNPKKIIFKLSEL
jgi:hypothetical protein